MTSERLAIAIVVVIQAMTAAALAFSGPEGFPLAAGYKYALGVLNAGLVVLMATMRSWHDVGPTDR